MPGAKDSQANPPKRDNKTHSDVSEESIDNVDIAAIHSDLNESNMPCRTQWLNKI